MEIDDLSQRSIEQLHVAEQRCLVYGMNRLDGFRLNKQAIVSQHIEASTAPLVDRLQQSRPFALVRINRPADGVTDDAEALAKKSRPCEYKEDRDNRAVISVAFVDSCSVQPHREFNAPSGVCFIGRQAGKALSSDLAGGHQFNSVASSQCS